MNTTGTHPVIGILSGLLLLGSYAGEVQAESVSIHIGMNPGYHGLHSNSRTLPGPSAYFRGGDVGARIIGSEHRFGGHNRYNLNTLRPYSRRIHVAPGLHRQRLQHGGHAFERAYRRGYSQGYRDAQRRSRMRYYRWTR